MFLALLHYQQHHFEIKCHTSRYDRVTYQLLKSSTGVGLIYFFNSFKKDRLWAISNRTWEEAETQDEELLQSTGAWRSSRAAESWVRGGRQAHGICWLTSSMSFTECKTVTGQQEAVNKYICCATVGHHTGHLLVFRMKLLKRLAHICSSLQSPDFNLLFCLHSVIFCPPLKNSLREKESMII